MRGGTRVTLLVAVLALAGVVVGGVAAGSPGVAGPGIASVGDAGSGPSSATAAPNATVAVERVNTNRIRVNVTFTNTTRNQTKTKFLVNVTDTGAANAKNVTFQSKRNGATYVTGMAVKQLTGPKTTDDLSAASVAVELNGSVLGTDSVNLQYADLSGASAAFDDGPLRVSGLSLRGFEPGSQVALLVGDGSLNATYAAGATEALVLDRSELSTLSRDELFGNARVAVDATAAPVNVTQTATSVNVHAAATDATRLVVAGESFVVENPLVGVLDANEYLLDVETTEPTGKYVGNVTASGDRVPLPSDAIGADVTANLTVADGSDRVVLDGWKGTYADSNVSVALNGSYVQVSPDVGAQSILFKTLDGAVRRVNLTNVGDLASTYAVAGNETVPANADLVVVGANAVYSGSSANANFQTPASAGNGTPTTTPTTTNGSTAGNTTASGLLFLPAGYTGVNTGILVVVTLLLGALVSAGLGVYRSAIDASVDGVRPTDAHGALIVLGFGLITGIIAGVLVIWLAASDLGPLGLLPAAGIGAFFSMVGSWPAAYGMASAGLWGKTSPKRRSTSRTETPVPVTVQIVTDDNRRVQRSVSVTARSTARSDDHSTTTDTGRAKLKLKPGTWTVGASVAGQQYETRVDIGSGHSRGKEARIVCQRPQIAVRLSDGADGEALPDATVHVEPDDGDPVEETTNRSGKAAVVLPFTATAATLSVSHPKYVGATRDVSLDDQKQAFDVGLERKTGSLSVTAEVDGVATGNLPVAIAPADGDDFRARERRQTLETDRNGTATVDVLVGDYVVDLDLPAAASSEFRTDTTTARIDRGGNARVSVRASFEWTLPPAVRTRLSDVREDVAALSDRAGRDVAFPRYYGSVVETLLDVVESLPEQGHRFVDVDTHPEAVADALLDVAEEAVTRVNTAMTTKRNVDVFAACADLPDAAVEFRGDAASFDAFLEHASDANDGNLTRRIEETKSRIDRERDTLTEVEPVTEVWELSRELFQEARRESDDVERAAKTLLVAALLDAVEEAFEHDQLRERMQQTVF
ncbi:hypothetical protein [Halorubellus litoreus]|uniref:Uncharacterized protein n=1 Tax=Halorubellus litoreus TaxID=755308 RepID=A0ABD5VN35_9EURY